jgi:GT2 family glycosyltransferase
MLSGANFRRTPGIVFDGARQFVRRHPQLKRVLLIVFGPILRHLMPRPFSLSDADYRAWIERFDELDEADRAAIRADVAALRDPPLISVVMPTYETPAAFLRAAIVSVRAQLYPHWELCIADDASPSAHVVSILEEAAREDPRIRWIRRDTNGHISAASNSALALARGDWVALMDHDDLLPEHALYELAVEIAAHPDAQVIYSDEDKIDAKGRRSDPYFKPDFDPDLLLGQNLISHLGAYRRDLLVRIGSFHEGLEGSQDHDLALRATAAAGAAAVRHIPAVLYHWRQAAGPASFSEASQARCIASSRQAVADHLAALGHQARVEAAPLVPSFNRVVWSVPDPAPLVSVIIPTRDRASLLRACLGGLLSGTDYAPIEVLIADNGSEERETLALFERLRADPRLRILPLPRPFNYSRLNNRAAAEARGKILLLLNNDVEVISPGWLREMVAHALRPEIGAVGAKLIYANGKLQHAGTILGVRGVAAHYMTGAPRHARGPFGLLALARTTSAVTAACLAVRRAVFEEVGGFDEENLPVAFNDVDLCLRIRECGYRNIWTPDAELYHLESASRGIDASGEKAERFMREVAYMRTRWGELLDDDPYYNPNLSLADAHHSLAIPPRRERPWRRNAAQREALVQPAGSTLENFAMQVAPAQDRSGALKA